MAAAGVAAPLERSLSKMMMKGGTEEVDLYADYKLKQREHEFLKIQVRSGAEGAGPPMVTGQRAIAPQSIGRGSLGFNCPARGTVGPGLWGGISLRRAGAPHAR